VAFSIEIQLEEGDNRIETKAVDFSGNESSDARSVTYTIVEQTVVTVMVDIKPGSCKNPFNLKSKGVVPVVVLGSETVDAARIDPASVRLKGVAPVRSVVDDAATLMEPAPASADDALCDTDMPDGYDDLVLKFDTQQLVAAIGDVSDGDLVTLPLIGAMFDGTEIAGDDGITILKKGNQTAAKKR
jgi:hypothetical protein